MNDIDFEERVKYLDGLETKMYGLLSAKPKYGEKAKIFSEINKIEKQIKDIEDTILEKSKYSSIKVKKENDIRTVSAHKRIQSRRQIRKGKVRELRTKYSTIYRDNFDKLKAETLQERKAQKDAEKEAEKQAEREAIAEKEAKIKKHYSNVSLEKQEKELKLIRNQLNYIQSESRAAYKEYRATKSLEAKARWKYLKEVENELVAERSVLYHNVIWLKAQAKANAIVMERNKLFDDNDAIEVLA
ncbi:hypothetical protein RE474_11455 [Methanolobus sediminis]|uniref:Uncharacterized protein n=1 Tax=Methanolobus sediminis TaxID=3072978 RepID=A0AA51YL74_9EURY|nr:hypothetical protein [Methanolobus sediminis]WMW24689.1 hypothetical protein RE474_11455 [Methanolobus sediminis]